LTSARKVVDIMLYLDNVWTLCPFRFVIGFVSY
jgi:hypothetical protein